MRKRSESSGQIFDLDPGKGFSHALNQHPELVAPGRRLPHGSPTPNPSRSEVPLVGTKAAMPARLTSKATTEAIPYQFLRSVRNLIHSE